MGPHQAYKAARACYTLLDGAARVELRGRDVRDVGRAGAVYVAAPVLGTEAVWRAAMGWAHRPVAGRGLSRRVRSRPSSGSGSKAAPDPGGAGPLRLSRRFDEERVRLHRSAFLFEHRPRKPRRPLVLNPPRPNGPSPCSRHPRSGSSSLRPRHRRSCPHRLRPRKCAGRQRPVPRPHARSPATMVEFAGLVGVSVKEAKNGA